MGFFFSAERYWCASSKSVSERGEGVRKRIQQNSCMQPTGFLIGELVDTIRKSHWKGRIRWQRAHAVPWYLGGCRWVLVLEVSPLKNNANSRFWKPYCCQIFWLLNGGAEISQNLCAKAKSEEWFFVFFFFNGVFAVGSRALPKLLGASEVSGEQCCC